MNKEFVLFLVAFYGDDCVVAGNIIQTCNSLLKYRQQLIDKYTVITQDDDTLFYKLNGKLHNEHNPAVVSPSFLAWYNNGVRCNSANGGPGYISKYTKQYFDDNGKLHRNPQYPAKVKLEDGIIVEKQYWVHGTRIK